MINERLIFFQNSILGIQQFIHFIFPLVEGSLKLIYDVMRSGIAVILMIFFTFSNRILEINVQFRKQNKVGGNYSPWVEGLLHSYNSVFCSQNIHQNILRLPFSLKLTSSCNFENKIKVSVLILFDKAFYLSDVLDWICIYSHRFLWLCC